MRWNQNVQSHQSVQIAPEGQHFSCFDKSSKSVEKNDKALNSQDSHYRSIAKAVSYRLGGSIATAGIAWVMTGEISIAAVIGLSDTFIKVGLFYMHERLWDRISFGRRKPPDYEI